MQPKPTYSRLWPLVLTLFSEMLLSPVSGIQESDQVLWEPSVACRGFMVLLFMTIHHSLRVLSTVTGCLLETHPA